MKLYEQRFGDCSVPTQWKENPQLGAWVANQRHLQKVSKLSGEKERLLTELGFVWAQQRSSTRGANREWNERFDELVQYKAKHGDCKVPTRWEENRGLGVWVSNQRQLKKLGRLGSERERMLNELGFFWGNSSHEEARLPSARNTRSKEFLNRTSDASIRAIVIYSESSELFRK